MSQNDLVISNQTFPATRADINNALQALGSLNSGSSSPATTYANMMWYDTANNILKMRSEANDAWISIGSLDQSLNTFTPFGIPESNPFKPTTVTGTTPSLDVGSFNFFSQGLLTGDTTVSFASVPTQARWTYSFENNFSGVFAEPTYASKSVSIGAGSWEGITFSTDGTKLYVVDLGGDRVYQYNLSTAWQLNTATNSGLSFLFTTQTINPVDVSFKPDGTKMFMMSSQGDVFEYTLSTPWAVNTASFVRSTLNISTGTTTRSMHITPDGVNIYSCDSTGEVIYQAVLGTAWDITTKSYQRVIPAGVSCYGMYVSNDGSMMLITDPVGNDIRRYALTTPYDVESAELLTITDVNAQDGTASGVYCKPDGTLTYMIGAANNKVFQYNSGNNNTLTLPASVENPPFEPVGPQATKRYTYEFYTLNGGTTVYLIDRESL